jgi:hypothetical protein
MKGFTFEMILLSRASWRKDAARIENEVRARFCVSPDDRLTGRMVATALTLAAVIKEPEKAPEKYMDILRIGLEVADGRRPLPSK